MPHEIVLGPEAKDEDIGDATPRSTLRTDYANLFAEIFCNNLAVLHTDAFLAQRRTASRKKCDCDFGEANLQQLIADRTRRRLPDDCPRLSVDPEHSGRVDYQLFLPKDEIVATCQLKGPLRPKAEDEIDNHLGDILEDIAKQRREAQSRKDVAHYVGVLFCLDESRAQRSIDQVWLPALQAETTASLSKAAVMSTKLLNGRTATACILHVKLQTHYPCGCASQQPK